MPNKICVVGTGYVGLVVAVGLSDFGNSVVGVDLDKNKVEVLNTGKSPIYEPEIEEYLKTNLNSGRLHFSSDIDKAILDSTVIFIAVGTPSKENGEADLTAVENVLESIAKNLKSYKVIVTKSTVPVGTNRWIKQRLLELAPDKEFDVVSNPEFLREGKAAKDFFNPDRTIIGCESLKARSIIEDVYKAIGNSSIPFVWCNLETAELIKYASNAFLATKITFINQIANLSEVVGADVRLISRAMGLDGRISSKFLHPGPGYGGSCFPKDTKALSVIGNNVGVEMSLIDEVIKSNERQKIRMVEKIVRYFNGNIKGKKIAVLGLAFKKETDDIRESPAITIIDNLIERGALVKAFDPKAMINFSNMFPQICYCKSVYETVEDADCLVIVTEWNEFKNLDLLKIKQLMKGNIIIDTRNVLSHSEIESIGFIYNNVGYSPVLNDSDIKK